MVSPYTEIATPNQRESVFGGLTRCMTSVSNDGQEHKIAHTSKNPTFDPVVLKLRNLDIFLIFYSQFLQGTASATIEKYKINTYTQKWVILDILLIFTLQKYSQFWLRVGLLLLFEGFHLILQLVKLKT